jgi:PAS domain S-box-containing protein
MKKMIELSLKDSEIRYRRLFEAAQDGILILDAKTGVIEDLNPYLIKMLGYSREEFIKKKLWEVGAFKDIKASQDAFEALQKNEYICYENLPLKAKNGKLIQVEFVSNVYLVGDEKVIQCNIRDITAPKQAEDALRKGEESYHNMLENMMEGCQIIGYDWCYLFINDSAVVQGKLKREELLGHTMMECYPGIEKTDMFAVLRRCMEERTSHIMVNEFIYPDSSRGWFELSIQPSPNGIFILSSDITERKRAEEALSESRAQLAGIIDAAMNAIITADADQRIVGFNLAAEKMFGYPAVHAIGQPLALLLPTRFRGTHREQVASFGNDGKTTRTMENLPTLAGVRANGEEFPIEISISRVEVAGKRLYTAIVRDITERKGAEQEIVSLAKFPSENPNPVLRLSREGLVMYANAASGALLGIWGCAVGGTTPQFWRDLAAQALANSENKTVDIECEGKVYSMVVTPVTEPGYVNLYARDITERKQAEEALRASKLIIEGIIDAIPMRIFWKDKDLVYLGCNAVFARDAGFTDPKDVIGKDDYQMGWRDQAELYRGDDRQVIESGSSKLHVEEPQTTPDGNTITLLTSKVPLRSSKGEVIGILGTYMDITQRKQTEEELRRSEEKYRDLVNTLNDGVFVSNDRGVLTFANQALARIHGFEHPEELVGRTFIQFVAPAMVGNIAQVFKESIQSRTTSETIEVEIIRANGIGAFIEIKPVPIVEDGKVMGIRGVVRDITERKQREEQMTRLNMAVNNSGEAIFMTDRDGVITFVNPGFTQFYGYTADEIVGKTTPRILKSGVMKSEDYAAFWQILLNKKVVKGELINRTKDGSLLNIESWSSPILNQQEEVIGFLSLQRDITQRKQREEEIRSRTDELATLYQLSRALSDANDLESVFELVNRHAVESVHTTFACIALLEDGELVTRAVYPVRSLEYDLNVGGRQPITALPTCQRVLEQNEPVILQAGSPEVGSAERAALLLDIAQSVCLVPLRVGDPSQDLNQALGLLILGEARNGRREPFTPEKVHLARSIGDQAAAAIRRLLLREQAGRRLKQLASLSEIDRTIASILDLRISLQMILKHVSEQLEVDAADVLVFNDRLQTLEFAAGRGFRSTAIEGKRLRLGEGQAGRAVLERRIIQIPDFAASGAAFAQSELLEAENVAAYFAMPLITKGQIKGVLEIYHRTPLEPNHEWLDFLDTLAGQAAIAVENFQLFEGLQRSTDELELAYDATIEGWSHALDLRDKETEGHTQRVTEMTVKLGRAFGLSNMELVQVRWGALLHDIGKLGVPDEILLKPGPLTDEEWVMMKRHPDLAYEMLSPINYLHAALDIPYCHHEKWDGSGYPRGLKGEQIPLTARIFAVVDVWDALNSDRPYRAAWPKEKVLDYIRSLAGTHFDPQVVKICLESGLLKG